MTAVRRPVCVPADQWARLPIGRRGLLTAIEDRAVREALLLVTLDGHDTGRRCVHVAVDLLSRAATNIAAIANKWTEERTA